MALGANAVWRLNPNATASNVNAGYFNPSNANFMTDLACDAGTGNTASPVVSSASYNFVAGDVGAWVYVQSGTNWTPGWYPIASVASNKATLNAAIGAAYSRTSRVYSANTVAGCATTGTPTAGVFGIDYSQSTAAISAITDLASTIGTTNPATVTSAGVPFGLNHVGNGLHITAGTNWTQDWYEVVSVSGVTATLDKACGSSATLSSGTAKVGGALSLNSSTDSTVLTKQVAGNDILVLQGSFTLGAGVTTSNGGTQNPIRLIGFASIPGDNPTGSTRPLLACGASNFIICGTNFELYYCQITGTNTTILQGGTDGKIIFCKAVNTSTTAARGGIYVNGSNTFIFGCEAISYRGRAMWSPSLATIDSCYFHDSDVGIYLASANAGSISGCIISSNVSFGCQLSVAITAIGTIESCTFYGAENKLGVGLSIITASRAVRLFKSILYGFTTGVSHADTQSVGYDDYNQYFNNTTDVTNWTKGVNDVATNPAFTNVAQLTGATATTSGSVLTQSGADFSSVTDNVDFCYLKSGTGITAGQYLITAHTTTTLTLDIAPGTSATADKVWQVTTGHNFLPTSPAAGYPGAFPGGLTTGFLKMGAVQPATGGGGGTIPLDRNMRGGFVN